MSPKKNQKKKYKILIIDDDKFLLDMYSLKFSGDGFEVDTALASFDALNKLEEKENCPDIILMDIVMPAMDGFELLEKIKNQKLCEDAAFIVLSNLGEEDEIARAKKLGADGYIVKANATPSEVVAKVLKIVSEKKNK